jgi:hypothetical protein
VSAEDCWTIAAHVAYAVSFVWRAVVYKAAGVQSLSYQGWAAGKARRLGAIGDGLVALRFFGGKLFALLRCYGASRSGES